MMKAAQAPGTGGGMPLGGGGPNPGQHSPNQNMHSGELWNFIEENNLSKVVIYYTCVHICMYV